MLTENLGHQTESRAEGSAEHPQLYDFETESRWKGACEESLVVAEKRRVQASQVD